MSTQDMSASPTGLTVVDDTAGGGTTLLVSSRLVMAANTTLQLTLLFTYLYLKANNFGGLWHPGGIDPPSGLLVLIALVIPVIGLVPLVAAASATRRGGSAGSVKRLLLLALVLAVLTGAFRIFVMYQFGGAWNVQNGTYVDVSVLWYAVVLAEFIAVGLWLFSMVMGHVRGNDPISPAQARAVLEQWTYVTGLAVVVYLLVEFVT